MADFTPLGVEAVIRGLGAFQKGLAEMGQGIENTGQKAEGIGGKFVALSGTVLKFGALAAGAALGGAISLAGGLAGLAFKTAATADELVELSDKTGISVERLQELKYIGEQTGTSVETVTGSLARMVRGMGDAATGTGAASDAFKKLNVPVKDANGNLRDSQQVFSEVVDALGKIENPTLRDSLAMDIFGRSAQELNPLINASAGGLADMAKEARNLGAVMSQESIESAAEFNDKLAGLKLGFQGIVSELGVAVIPILTGLLDNVIKPLIPTFQTVIGTLGDFITNLGEGGLARAVGLLGVSFAESNPKLASFLVQLSTGIGNVITWVRDTLIPAFQQFLDFLIPAAGQGLGFLGQAFNTVKDVLVGVWNDFLKPIFTELVAFFQEAIPIAIGFLVGFWNEHLLPAFTTLSAAFQENILPLLQELYAWLAENLPKAIKTAGDFWKNTLVPAMTEVWDWIGENLIPVLTEIAVWLMENIPVAIKAASDFWTGTLQPALAEVWAFISENVIPIVQEVAAWLAENVPEAIQILSDYWTGTLLPAITDVWNFFNEYILPVIQDVIDIAVQLGEIALTALAGYWENVLLPALTAVYNWFNENILPILEKVTKYIQENIGPAVQWLADKVFKPLAATLSGAVKSALQWVHDQLAKLKGFLDNFQLPDWLTPGSPTPLEIGLLGIAAAAEAAGSAFDFLGKKAEEAGKKPKYGWMLEFLDIAGKYGSLGGAAASRYKKSVIDPLQAQLDALDETLAEKRAMFEEDQNFSASETAEILRLEAERVRLAEAYARAQEHITALEKQQADLAFLKSQLDFLKLIKEENLDLNAILGGLKLGLDVSLPDLIDAMTRAMQEMIGAVNDELQLGSPSRVFMDIGKQVMAGLAGGIKSTLAAPAGAMQSALASLAAAPRLSAPNIVRQQSVQIGPNTVGDQMDLMLLASMVERAMVGGMA